MIHLVVLGVAGAAVIHKAIKHTNRAIRHVHKAVLSTPKFWMSGVRPHKHMTAFIAKQASKGFKFPKT